MSEPQAQPDPTRLHNGAQDGQALLKALGLEGRVVEKVVIIIQGGQPTKVHVTELIRMPEMGLVEHHISKYSLVPQVRS